MRSLLVSAFLLLSTAVAADQSTETRQLQSLSDVAKAIAKDEIKPFNLGNKTALDTLVDALKGTSSFVGLLSDKQANSNDQTKELISKIKADLAKAVEREEKEAKRPLGTGDRKTLHEQLQGPITSYESAVAGFSNEEATKKKLQDVCSGEKTPLTLIEYILKNAGGFLSRNYVSSTGSSEQDYAESIKPSVDETSFLGLADRFRELFYHAYMLHVACNRAISPKFEQELPKVAEKFVAESKKLEDIIKEESRKFYNAFLKTAHIEIERSIGGPKKTASFLNPARKIFERLAGHCPVRDFVVSVYEPVSGDDKVARIPFDADSMVNVMYNNNGASVILNTENYMENSKKYKEMGVAKHVQLFKESYDESSLKKSLENYQKKLGGNFGTLIAMTYKTYENFAAAATDSFNYFIYRPSGENICTDFGNCKISEPKDTDIFVVAIH